MKKSLIALLVVAGMVSASWAQTIINTDFTAGDLYSDGTIIGQNNWTQMPNTDPNAFAIADAAGAGFADGTLTTADLSTNLVGQYVYLNTASAGNSADDEWSGEIDFVLDAGSATNLPNTKSFNIGLTAVSTNKLHESDLDDVFINLRTTAAGNLDVRFNGRSAKKLVAGWPGINLGWGGADVKTDPMRINWTVRKTSDEGIYAAYASVTNLLTGSNITAGAWAYDSRPGVWSNAAPDFAMGRHENADYNGGSNVLSIVIDNLSVVKNSVLPTPVAPVVSALGGDTQAILSWTFLYDVDSYTIERSLTPTFGYSIVDTISNTNTTYVDTGLVNNTPYYYKVTANYDAVPATSVEVSVTPIAVVTGNIFNEDFTAVQSYVDGELAGQADWDVAGSNAFEVIASAGSGFADTEPVVGLFDSTNGNAIYWAKAMSNTVGATWTGSIDFQITAQPFPGVFGTNTVFVYDATGTNVIGTNVFSEAIARLDQNQEKVLLNIGLSAAPTNVVNADANNQVTLQIATRANEDISVKLMSGGNPRALFNFMTQEQVGWNPEWKNNGGGNTNTNNIPPDFTTDMLRLTYTIRKEAAHGWYLAMASMTNLVTGVASTNDPAASTRVEAFHEHESQATYDSPLVQFVMAKDGEADGNANPPVESMTDILIDSVSLVHELDAGALLFSPLWKENDPVMAGNASLTLQWSSATQESDSYKVYRSVIDGGPYTEMATITNGVQTYADSGLNNVWTYYYVLTSLSGTNESAYSEQRSGIPVPVTHVLKMGGGPGTWSDKTGNTGSWDNLGGTTADNIRTMDGTITPFLTENLSWEINPGEYHYTENTLRGIMQWEDGEFRRARVLASGNQNIKYEQINKTTSTTNCSALLYVRQDEFDVPGALDLTASTFTYELISGNLTASDKFSAGQGGPRAAHAAVQQGGTWYVSETAVSNSNTIITIEDLGASSNNWTILDTTVSSSFISVAGQSYSPVVLTNVTAIGWFAVNFEQHAVISLDVEVSDLSTITGYQFWEAENLILPPSIGDDLDLDGRINLYEFGLNGDPNDDQNTGVDPEVEVVNIGGTNYVQYIHLRRKGTNLGIDYKLKDTVNLVFIPMTNDAAVAGQSVGDYDANYETVTNLIPTAESEKFIRLELEEL